MKNHSSDIVKISSFVKIMPKLLKSSVETREDTSKRDLLNRKVLYDFGNILKRLVYHILTK